MIDIVIHGKPVGKARPRFGRRKDGGVMTYTPRETKNYEQSVAALAQCAMMGKSMMQGPLRVTISAYFQHKTKTGYHISRPDLDNIVKAILDGLNGVVFEDDAAVASIVAMKQYGEERVEVIVENV
jgi:Holliday junction resolvase RusA-like endonuclease